MFFTPALEILNENKKNIHTAESANKHEWRVGRRFQKYSYEIYTDRNIWVCEEQLSVAK